LLYAGNVVRHAIDCQVLRVGQIRAAAGREDRIHIAMVGEVNCATTVPLIVDEQLTPYGLWIDPRGACAGLSFALHREVEVQAGYG
jgi:hypothetical protein